ALPHAPSRAAIDAIMAWLRDRLHAGPADFATAPYVPSPPATVLTRGASGITDHATLLVAVLRQAGIRADLVLLDTGPGTDVDPDLPGLSQFDHVIVRARLATGDVWIDPTETLVAPGQLPPRVQGRRGLVIASDTKGLIAIPAAAPGDNAIREVRTFAAAERGRASLTVVTRATGALESQLRVAFSTRPRLPKKSAVEDPDLARYGGAVTSASSTTVGDVATPFVVTREIASTQRVRCQGEYVDIDLPSGDVLVEIPWTARYQSKTVRTRDYVWTTPVIHEIENRIDLPPGFAPPEPPPERVVHLGPATFRELRRVEGQTLIVALRFESGKLRWTAAELRSMQQALPALEKQPIRIEVESTAHALLEAGKLREAAAEDARLIALHPREALHHEQLAVLLIRAGLGDAARREARAAAALEPTNATTLTQLAWVLVHDRLGRGSRFDWDRAGALEALHKARALAPDHPGAAYHLALVQERGASGALFAPDADLRSAVEAWTAARDTEHDDATTLHLAHTLLWAGQPIAAETLARTTKPDAQRDATIVAAIAEAQGAAAAIAEAGKLRSGDERTRLIQQVMWEERDRRRYDLSRAMFAEIRSANQVAAFWAAAIAHLSSHPDVAPGSSDPRTALADLFRAMPDPARKTPVFWDARVEADLRGDAHRSMPPPSERAGAQRLLSDVLQSANYRIEGGDGVWRAHGDGEWAPKLVIYLVLDRGVVKVVGASDHTSGIGRYVLGLDLHDGAAAGRARRLLDFVRGDLEAATAHIPTLFKRMWGRGQPTTNDAMQVAAAVLANETDADRALAVVQRCAPRSADAQYACHAVRALLLRQRERWVDAVTEYQAAVALEPGELAFALVPYTRALAALGRRADADRLVDGFVAAHPDDGVGLLVRYELALEAGDAAEATRRLDALERAPNTTSWQLNRAAWEQLGRGGDLARGLQLARKAVDMAKLAHAERNTLAMLEAETGDLDAAARDSREAMLHGNSDQPEDSDWCVAARIAEQLGQTGDAIAIYRRIAKPGDARFSLAGYAAQRLAALQRSP
ncbi:MAG TPA: hypothetical protein VIX73_35615, partial [Kofleriaceae bacterium]